MNPKDDSFSLLLAGAVLEQEESTNLFNSLSVVWFELRDSVRGTGQRTKHSSSPDTENVLLPSKFNFSTDVLCKYKQVSLCLLLPEHL